MLHIASILSRQLAPMLAPAVVLATVGCREEAESPTAPGAEPAVAVTAATALRFRQVSAGNVHSCGVTTDNRAFCWGEGAAGELGDGKETSSSTPVRVAGDLRFLQVNAGGFYTCGMTTDNKAYYWGDNSFGQLGDGTKFTRLTPVAVAGGHRFSQLDAGLRHTCSVTPGHRAFCWGDNLHGESVTGSGVWGDSANGPGLVGTSSAAEGPNPVALTPARREDASGTRTMRSRSARRRSSAFHRGFTLSCYPHHWCRFQQGRTGDRPRCTSR
jgi:hypothetical protein